jgi:hypothetical protein
MDTTTAPRYHEQPQPAFRTALRRYFLCSRGSFDVRVEYTHEGRVETDIGTVVDGGWRWEFGAPPQDVEEAAGKALLAYPVLLSTYGGTETSEQMRDEVDDFYDREIGPDDEMRAVRS